MYRGRFTAHLCRSAALGALLAASPAFAQQTTTQTVETTQPADEPQEEDDRVVITGSRLPTQFETASPMTIISADDAAQQGVADVAQLLRNSTVAAGSPQITALTSTAFVQDGGTGVETISLRGLGANRTLVLLDGRRAGPAGTRGGVGAFDLNVIPLSAIERVEILKDGASSIYGSDAVAGVINIITRKDDGADFDLFYSMPIEPGGEQLRASGSWGQTFDNFHFRVTADYYKQQELKRGDRDSVACSEPYVFNEDGSRADLVDPRTGRFQCSGDRIWGHVWFYDYLQPGAISQPWRRRPQLFQFDYDGDLGNYIPPLGPTSNPLTVPAGWFPVGYGELAEGGPNDPYYTPFADTSDAIINYNHPYLQNVSMIPEIERMTVMASGEYDLNDEVTLYGEILLNRRMTKVEAYRQIYTYQYVYDYGGGDYGGDPLAYTQGWTGSFVGFSPLSITDKSGETTTVDYMRVVGGAEGEFGNGWEWNVAAQFSRSEGQYKEEIVWDDAITPYENRSELCAGTVTEYRGVPCVDIDWYDPNFLRGVFTAEEEAFLFGTVTGNTVYEQASLEAYISGELMELPAGPLGFVLGGLYQEDSIDDVPAQAVQDGQNWNASSAGITRGEDTSQAVYAELGVPILRDLPFVQDLSFTASGRYNDVESYGSQSTYKAGLNWTITPEWRVRASQGTSFRSPALFELYLANQTGFLDSRQVDICINWGDALASGGINQRIADNCAADGVPEDYTGAGSGVTVQSSGGFGVLEAETSEAKTLGVIWTPEFADLQVSLDYFDIVVEDEVTQLGANNIILGCYDSLTFSTEPLCDLFNRNPAGGTSEFTIDLVIDNYINIATQKNRGLDLNIAYGLDVGFGDLDLRLQASYQLDDEVTLLPTSDPIDFNGEIGDPTWVGAFDTTLNTGPWSLFWGMRYVGETSNVDSFGGQPQTYRGENVRYVLETDDFLYHNLSIGREFEGGIGVRIGVSNVFDTQPPSVTTDLSGEYNSIGNAPLDGGQYDFLGRTVFANITKTF